MAKTEKSGGLVGGAFRSGTAMGVLYELMEDGKSHTLSAIKKEIGKLASNVSNRVSLLHRTGKANGKWFVSKDGETVKLVFGKFKAEKKEKASSKPDKPSKKEKSKKAGGGKPKVQDVPAEDED